MRFLLSVFAVLAAALLLPRVPAWYRAWRDRPDHAWKPTGYTRAFDGHDETKAPQAAKRAEAEVRARRRIAIARTAQPKAANVIAMPARRKAQ